MSAAPLVIVVDDETGSRESMALAIEKTGLAVRAFDEAALALDYLADEPSVRLAVCDLKMPHMDGIAFINAVRQKELDLGIILVTGYGSIESAVEAMQVGADDYLTKPVDLYELRQRVMSLLENRELKEEVSSLRQMLDKRYGFDNIIGSSEPMERLFEQMRLVAPTQSSVLIVGESGTGKELVAKAIHHASTRTGGRFLALNCGAIPSDILESELFGHEKGAFTGAISRKIGKFEMVQGGTLFLDEISELYPALQVKLLRVLEERQMMRVGGGDLIDLDFRLLAATNRDLEKEVVEGRFREDLYYRLKVVTLKIPPLRERPADLPQLADHFLGEFAEREGKTRLAISADALAALSRYPWRGNVRELRNLLESVAIFHAGHQITESDLPPELLDAVPSEEDSAPVQPLFGPPKTMAAIERQAILETLERTNGKRSEAARLLGIGLRTLQRKLKDYRDAGYVAD